MRDLLMVKARHEMPLQDTALDVTRIVLAYLSCTYSLAQLGIDGGPMPRKFLPILRNRHLVSTEIALSE